MGKQYKEIKLFNVGTVRNSDESDTPEESATFSVNLETNTDYGILTGRKTSAVITQLGLTDIIDEADAEQDLTAIDLGTLAGTTNKGDFSTALNIDGVYDLIYYDGVNNVMKIVNNIYKGQGSSDDTTEISVSTLKSGSYKSILGEFVEGSTLDTAMINNSDTTAMEVNNKAIHIGMDDGASKWVGVVKHDLFGHFQSSDGTSDGTFSPIMQDGALKQTNIFPAFQWVVSDISGGLGYIYAAEWKGQYIYRFKYTEANNNYEFLGKGATTFGEIHGIAACQKLASESASIEPGVWVYDSNVGDNGTLYRYFVNGIDITTMNHNIESVDITLNNSGQQDECFIPNQIGGIVSNQSNVSGNNCVIYFSKWLKQTSVVMEHRGWSDTQNRMNADINHTSPYLQDSFLWRTKLVVGSWPHNGSITLVNKTPILSVDLKKSRTGSSETNVYQGAENVFVANPRATMDATTGEGVGGSGMLQGGGTGADFLKMTTGFHTAKKCGDPSVEAITVEEFHPDAGFNHSTTGIVHPRVRALKADPFPSIPWKSIGDNDCGVTNSVLSAKDYRTDQLGLLFGFYDNIQRDRTYRCAGVLTTGYFRGKGYWNDSNEEDIEDLGSTTDNFGIDDASSAHETGDHSWYRRATGGLWSEKTGEFSNPGDVSQARIFNDLEHGGNHLGLFGNNKDIDSGAGPFPSKFLPGPYDTASGSSEAYDYQKHINDDASGITSYNKYRFPAWDVGYAALDTWYKLLFVTIGHTLYSMSYDALGKFSNMHRLGVEGLGTDISIPCNYKYSGGQIIDTTNRLLFIGGGNAAGLRIIHYGTDGSMELKEDVGFEGAWLGNSNTAGSNYAKPFEGTQNSIFSKATSDYSTISDCAVDVRRGYVYLLAATKHFDPNDSSGETDGYVTPMGRILSIPYNSEGTTPSIGDDVDSTWDGAGSIYAPFNHSWTPISNISNVVGDSVPNPGSLGWIHASSNNTTEPNPLNPVKDGRGKVDNTNESYGGTGVNADNSYTGIHHSCAYEDWTDWHPKNNIHYAGTMGIDTNWSISLLFYTGGQDSHGVYCVRIGASDPGKPDYIDEYPINGVPNYANKKFLDLSDSGTPGAQRQGCGIGFKVDPVNHVIYGRNSRLGVWTAKYDRYGNMGILSSVKSGYYGSETSYGSASSDSGVAVDFTSSAWKRDVDTSYAMSYSTQDDFKRYDHGTNSPPDHFGSDVYPTNQTGSSAVCLALMNQYHAENQQDDSYCTSAQVFCWNNQVKGGSSDASTGAYANTDYKSFLAGMIYNYQAEKIEIPRNALYKIPSQDGYIGMVLRLNGYSWDNSGHPTITRQESQGASHADDDAGVSGNMCAFKKTNYTTGSSTSHANNTQIKSATWASISIPYLTADNTFNDTTFVSEDDNLSETKHSIGISGRAADGMSFRIFKDSALGTTSTFPVGAADADRYDLNTNNKDRIRMVWSTPHSVSIVPINSTGPDYFLFIACGRGAYLRTDTAGPLTILGYKEERGTLLETTEPDIYNDLGQPAVIGEKAFPFIEKNKPLYLNVPDAKIPDMPHTGDYSSKGLLNMFSGAFNGAWLTAPFHSVTSQANLVYGFIDSTGNDTLSFLTDEITDYDYQFRPAVVLTAEIDTSGNGYSTGDVGNIFYKTSFIYDGFQEGALGEDFVVALTEDANVKVTIKIASTKDLRRHFARVTHIKLYRAVNQVIQEQDPVPEGYYRFITQAKISTSEFIPSTEDDGEVTWSLEFTDSNKVSYSYESSTGINEVITDTSLRYALSTQINNMHIVGKARSYVDSSIGDNVLFKSRPYNFDQFNILTDRLNLPYTPTTIKAYEGRVYAFDKTQTTRIEPNQFYMEDTFPNAGCISPKTIVTSDYGMFYADESNIYMNTGTGPKVISTPIQDGTYAWNNAQVDTSSPYLCRIKNANYEVMAFDPKTYTLLVFFRIRDNKKNNTELNVDSAVSDSNLYNYAWGYNLIKNRWDLHYCEWNTSNEYVVASGTSPDGYAILYLSDGTSRVWGADTQSVERWTWHSKLIDFGTRNLTKRLRKIKLDGISDDASVAPIGTETPLGGNVTLIGAGESSHPKDENKRLGLKIGEGNYGDSGEITDITKVVNTSNTDTDELRIQQSNVKLKGTASKDKAWKLKLENQKGEDKISSIGFIYRIRGYK